MTRIKLIASFVFISLAIRSSRSAARESGSRCDLQIKDEGLNRSQIMDTVGYSLTCMVLV